MDLLIYLFTAILRNLGERLLGLITKSCCNTQDGRMGAVEKGKGVS